MRKSTHLLPGLIILLAISQFLSADELTLEIEGKRIELLGNILIEAEDRSLYFQSSDGKIWFIEPAQVVRRVDHADPAKPASKRELRGQLATELPGDFRFHETKNYLIAYQTEVTYARWIGNLFETRLFRQFETFWKKKKLELTDPEFPLVILIFRNAAEYNAYVKKEFGEAPSMIAYYNLQTNRVAMYDLTWDVAPRNQTLNDRRLEEILQSPTVFPMIATVVHEGTHQLIFNRGVQTRFADTPLWLNEGLAVYFETPSPVAKHGWREPGLVNYGRLSDFRNHLNHRQPDSLQQLIRSDDLLRSNDTPMVLAKYAESWALVHFLMNERSEFLIGYLQHTSTKKPLKMDTPEKRLADFELFFGNDWNKLDAEFLEYVRKLR